MGSEEEDEDFDDRPEGKERSEFRNTVNNDGGHTHMHTCTRTLRSVLNYDKLEMI